MPEKTPKRRKDPPCGPEVQEHPPLILREGWPRAGQEGKAHACSGDTDIIFKFTALNDDIMFYLLVVLIIALNLYDVLSSLYTEPFVLNICAEYRVCAWD